MKAGASRSGPLATPTRKRRSISSRRCASGRRGKKRTKSCAASARYPALAAPCAAPCRGWSARAMRSRRPARWCASSKTNTTPDPERRDIRRSSAPRSHRAHDISTGRCSSRARSGRRSPGTDPRRCCRRLGRRPPHSTRSARGRPHHRPETGRYRPRTRSVRRRTRPAAGVPHREELCAHVSRMTRATHGPAVDAQVVAVPARDSLAREIAQRLAQAPSSKEAFMCGVITPK